MADLDAASTPAAARAAFRAGQVRPTCGVAQGYAQANLMILPKEQAFDFLLFAQRNPKPCPLLGVSEPGDPRLPNLGEDLDIRTDVPAYRIWRNGELVEEVTDIRDCWRDDLVTFVLGCSFSFEQALIDAGIPLRHVLEGRNVAMYRTNIPTVPAGVFHGPMVVSMRPMTAAHAIRAVQVTARVPAVHGAPVHIGKPEMIGIDDLAKVDAGGVVSVAEDELPLFWACGVTPQAVVAATKPPFCITHAPGCMLVTDLLNSRLAVF